MAAKKSFPLRIDPKLFDVLEGWAADELRSINSHIEFLLRESARKAGRLKGGSAPLKSAEGTDAKEAE